MSNKTNTTEQFLFLLHTTNKCYSGSPRVHYSWNLEAMAAKEVAV